MKVRKALSLLLLLVLASTLIPSAQAGPLCQDPQDAVIRQVLVATAGDLGWSTGIVGGGYTIEGPESTDTLVPSHEGVYIMPSGTEAGAAEALTVVGMQKGAYPTTFHGYAAVGWALDSGSSAKEPVIRLQEMITWQQGSFLMGASAWWWSDSSAKDYAEVLYANVEKYGLIGAQGTPPPPTPTEAAGPPQTPTPIPTATATLTGMPSPTPKLTQLTSATPMPTETPRPKAALGKTPSLTTTSPDAAAKGPPEAIGDLLSGYSLNVPQSIAQLTGEMPSIGANLGLGIDINDPGQIRKTLDWGQKTVSDIYTGIDLVNTIASFTPYGKVVGKVADRIKGAGQPLKDLLDKKKNYNDSLKTLNQDPRFQSMSDDEKGIRAEIMAEIKSKVSKALGDAVPSVGSADAIMTGLSHLQPEYSKVTMDHDVGGQKIAIDTDFSHWTSGHVINSAVDHGSTSTWQDLGGVVQTQWTDVRDADGVLAKAAHVGKAAAVTTYATGVAVVKVAVDGASFVAGKAYKAWQGLKGLF